MIKPFMLLKFKLSSRAQASLDLKTEQAKSKEQRAKSKEQRAKSKELKDRVAELESQFRKLAIINASIQLELTTLRLVKNSQNVTGFRGKKS